MVGINSGGSPSDAEVLLTSQLWGHVAYRDGNMSTWLNVKIPSVNSK